MASKILMIMLPILSPALSQEGEAVNLRLFHAGKFWGLHGILLLELMMQIKVTNKQKMFFVFKMLQLQKFKNVPRGKTVLRGVYFSFILFQRLGLVWRRFSSYRKLPTNTKFSVQLKDLKGSPITSFDLTTPTWAACGVTGPVNGRLPSFTAVVYSAEAGKAAVGVLADAGPKIRN